MAEGADRILEKIKKILTETKDRRFTGKLTIEMNCFEGGVASAEKTKTEKIK